MYICIFIIFLKFSKFFENIYAKLKNLTRNLRQHTEMYLSSVPGERRGCALVHGSPREARVAGGPLVPRGTGEPQGQG